MKHVWYEVSNNKSVCKVDFSNHRALRLIKDYM